MFSAISTVSLGRDEQMSSQPIREKQALHQRIF